MDGMKKKLAFLLSTSPYLDVVDGRSYEKAAEDLIANGVTFAADTKVGDKRTQTEPLTNCQQWISVTDRLPKDEKPVLAYYGFCNDGDYGFGMMFVGTISYFAFDPHPHWQHSSAGLVVTHWMPLPEPPKEE